MATVEEIKSTLDVLCRYYRDKDNNPRKLDDVQIAVYLDGLVEFTADDLEFAARQWMRTSRWFPALSDLRQQLEGEAPDWNALATMAWTTLERTISAAGVYRGARFVDGAIGETARQIFGSWVQACNYERDSPGWAICRQNFLSLFPVIAKRGQHEPTVTLKGIGNGPSDAPLIVQHNDLIPKIQPRLSSRDESKNVLAEVRRRFQALTPSKP